MLNVISRSIVSSHTRGPRKVVLNLLKGLNELGYPYITNGALDATKTLWIHDDPVALLEAMKLQKDVAILAGPNIYTRASEIPESVDMTRLVYLHPASWVQEFWQISTTRKIPSLVWPVGVDTNQFCPDLTTNKDFVLVYNKQRSPDEVEAVCTALDAQRERYQVITYGNYSQKAYRDLLARAKALIWVGRSESQGIGLLEALAMNVPALVWEITKFGQWTGTGHQGFREAELNFSSALTAPYFSSSCGLKFNDRSVLESKLSEFLSKLPEFTPRSYVEENLSLRKQAQSFIDIYLNHLKQSQSSLMDTTINNPKKWQNDRFYFKLKTRLKDALRQIIR